MTNNQISYLKNLHNLKSILFVKVNQSRLIRYNKSDDISLNLKGLR